MKLAVSNSSIFEFQKFGKAFPNLTQQLQDDLLRC